MKKPPSSPVVGTRGRKSRRLQMISMRMRGFFTLVKLFPTALLLVFLTGCSTPTGGGDQPVPELVIYHVKPGSENEVEELLKRKWNVLRKEHFVLDQPHICVRVNEDVGKVRFIETFTWVSPGAAEYPPDSVKAIWEEIQRLCEDRGGNKGVEDRGAEIIKFER